MADRVVTVDLPPWAAEYSHHSRVYPDDEARMGLAVLLARRNIEQRTGGPFGAAVFDRASGQLVSLGVNSVVRLNNCTLHAEMVALQFATTRHGRFSLDQPGERDAGYGLVTSCEPCAMCLGAVLWSGVSRVVCGAAREDATQLGFDEGPVFPASWEYLRARGIEIVLGVRRVEARAVLELYRGRGPIYNG